MVFPAGRFVVVPTAPDYSLSGGNESRPVRRRPDAGLPHDVLPPRPEAVLARPACFQSPPLESDPSDIPRPRTDTQAPYGKQRTGGLADPPVVLRPSPEPRINRHPTSTVPLRYIYHVESLGGGRCSQALCPVPQRGPAPQPPLLRVQQPGPRHWPPRSGDIWGGGACHRSAGGGRPPKGDNQPALGKPTPAVSRNLPSIVEPRIRGPVPDRKKQAQVLVDTTTTPLGFFVKAVLQGHFAFAEPLLDGDHGGVYDHEVHQGPPPPGGGGGARKGGAILNHA